MPPRGGLFILWVTLVIAGCAWFIWYFFRNIFKLAAEKIDSEQEREEIQTEKIIEDDMRELNQDRYTMVVCQRCHNVRRRAENVTERVRRLYQKGLCRQCAFELTSLDDVKRKRK